MSYYTRLGEHTFRPTEHAGGAWNPAEVHFSPLGGLILHEIDRHRGDRGSSLARVSFDILGFLGTEECEIHVETIRPGRTIELVEAVATIGGRTVVRARAWFLADFDTSAVAGGAAPALPAPETIPATTLMTDRWTGGFVHSLEVRPVLAEQGRATVWLSSEHAIVDDEPSSGYASFISLVDTANGIATRQPPTEWAFPNVDLTIHLHRHPHGPWVGLDTTVTFGPSGQGVTSTVLHDEAGAIGFAHQMLTVRPLGGE
jgi:acyl-CoA thioesterase